MLRSDAGTGQGSIGDDDGIWHYDVARVQDQITKFMIQEALPFDHFDNRRFTALVQDALQPKYKQVTSRTLRRDFLKLWKNDKEELITGFESLQTGSNITTDVRTAPHGCPKSYICVTAHWVNLTTWQMMKRTIVFELFNHPHTSQTLFNILCYVF